MEKTALDILTANELKHTRPRMLVLEELAANESAVSQPALEKKLKEIDRVTLYRILNLFEQKGILHRIMDKNGTANFAVCEASCSADHHHDEHLHFNCDTCHKVYCLPVKLPRIKIPEGYTAASLSTIAYGTCEKCNKKKI